LAGRSATGRDRPPVEFEQTTSRPYSARLVQCTFADTWYAYPNDEAHKRSYPIAVQQRAPLPCHKLHCDLEKAAVQERIDAYRPAGKTIGFAAQCKSLTEIRTDPP
jgi:hypothetical protein